MDDLLQGEYSALHIAANNDHMECVGILVLLVSEVNMVLNVHRNHKAY